MTAAKNETAARNIKAFRLDRGLTQAEFAKAVGRRQSTVSKWESGEAPRLRSIIAISAAFGIGVNELLPLILGQEASANQRL